MNILGTKCQMMVDGHTVQTLTYMKEISKYWVDKFNWKSVEEKINKFQNFKSNIEWY